MDFVCLLFFFFKQKTAYEMRISDWSSDVCSSDLWPRRHGSDVREDIGFGPAGEVQLGAGGKEIKTCLGQSGAMLAGEPFVQLFPEAVKIADVRRRIILLRFRQLRRAPVGRLLLLGNLREIGSAQV